MSMYDYTSAFASRIKALFCTDAVHVSPYSRLCSLQQQQNTSNSVEWLQITGPGAAAQQQQQLDGNIGDNLSRDDDCGDVDELQSSPLGRWKQASALLNGWLYIHGGRRGRQPLKDTWRWHSSIGWERLVLTGCAPPHLDGHTMTGANGRLYLFGGTHGGYPDCPMWIITPRLRLSKQWQAGAVVAAAATDQQLVAPVASTGRLSPLQHQNPHQQPSSRRNHSAVLHNGQLYIFGGYADRPTNELWRFNLRTEDWQLVWPVTLALSDVNSDNSPAISSESADLNSFGPGPRFGHSACAHDCGMYVFGGYSGLNLCQPDLWRWSFRIGQWSRIRLPTESSSGSAADGGETFGAGPQSVAFHAACVVQGHMLVFGGETRDQRPTEQLWSLKLATETWAPVRPSQPRHLRPRGYVHHTLIPLSPPNLYNYNPQQQQQQHDPNRGREFASTYSDHPAQSAQLSNQSAIELAPIRGSETAETLFNNAGAPAAASWAFANPSLSVSSGCGSTIGAFSADEADEADDVCVEFAPLSADCGAVLCLGAQENGLSRSSLALWRGCVNLG